LIVFLATPEFCDSPSSDTSPGRAVTHRPLQARFLVAEENCDQAD